MSFNIALSGLQATTQDLNTISNNIANASTNGFRGGRSEFASIYNGGQAGGVGVMSTTQNFSQGGSLTYTGRQLDMGIQGEGFFVLKGSDGGAMYARAGMFHKDSEGFITDPVGSRLQGYSVNATGQLQAGNVGDLQVQTGSLPAKSTTKVGLVSNLDARVEPIAVAFDPKDINTYHSIGTSSVYDSLGAEHVVTQYYVKTAANEWTVNYTLDGAVLPDTTQLTFDTNGVLNPATTKQSLDLTLSNGATNLKFDIDFDKSTQYAAKYNNSSLSQDGYTSGELKGVRLDDNGMLYGTYTNGQDQLQGQVVLANFSNPNGLSAVSNNAWVATNTAGQAITGAPASGTMGTVTGGYLEGSNVDTTAEMVNLMTAQRNYQSNAKVLDVNSTMQQALLNAI
ncbi:flagellar hook protein FlgE [Shewanella glacialipiscicola]|uniref:flagellar hook protein FlgE n=1 Tax=Shewanella glacialipiscicola TaxID=614069 RepID=UPI003D7931EE